MNEIIKKIKEVIYFLFFKEWNDYDSIIGGGRIIVILCWLLIICGILLPTILFLKIWGLI